MITLAMLIGPNGLINKSLEAKIANDKAEIQDRAETEVLASINDKGKINWGDLKKNLAINFGIEEETIEEKKDGENVTGLTFTVQKNKRNYKIDINEKGKVTVTSEGEGTGSSSSDPSASTMKVELKVDEGNVTGTKIPVSVAKITTDKNKDKTNDENLTYKWYINNATSKDDNGTSECTFNDLDDKTTYTIKCSVTDKSTGEQGTGEVTVLSFQVVDSLYRGTQGMTWYEWTNSSYAKPFPLNEEHYYDFLKKCGWDRFGETL